MKRFLFVLMLIVAIVGVMLAFMPRSLDKRLSLSKEVCCQVYCKKTTAKALSVGYGLIVKCNGDDFAKVISRCQQVDGVSFSWNASRNEVDSLLNELRAKTVSQQRLGNLIVVCAYSPQICRGVVLDGCLVNLQIAFDGQTLTVGSPLILGSY